MFKLEWTVGEKEKMLLRDFLKEKNISKAALTDIKFKGGKILVNSREQNVRYLLKEHDHVTIFFPPEIKSSGLLAEKLPLNILYEDDYLLVINKEYGMSTIPSREHPRGSLANGLVGYYNSKNLNVTTHIVTRLDRDTSGIALIAKHRHIHHLLSQQQKLRAISRRYLAFAEGRFQELKGTIDKPIGRSDDSIIKREVKSDGQTAITHFSVQEVHDDFSVVELFLETGRTHQIRVHLSSMGHPLLGDDLYGGKRTLINRQALHCVSLKFIHPVTERGCSFFAPLPKDMERLL
ncbi:RluA family pseudouridine synthase [Niallia nealsonii]|uniref:Pseudouridine synthase n=1 Tax=Niallia nealsonii TaxID=115979 RepID=A0A2N0Z7Z5_9BACI|nr:RluA family pseudouridine synthase [Niallia nealsonii]PKG25635.1 RNA pseudouridine synthase [Niallia nealsonii]